MIKNYISKETKLNNAQWNNTFQGGLLGICCLKKLRTSRNLTHEFVSNLHCINSLDTVQQLQYLLVHNHNNLIPILLCIVL
jgi:hypothetical protein